MHVWYNCRIDWFRHIINVTFIQNYFCFWAGIKIVILCFIFTFCFLNTKTDVVSNLNPINSDNNSISFFLIVDSVSPSCSSGLKELKILILWVLAKPLKASSLFIIYVLFFVQKIFTFFVTLYNATIIFNIWNTVIFKKKKL